MKTPVTVGEPERAVWQRCLGETTPQQILGALGTLDLVWKAARNARISLERSAMEFAFLALKQCGSEVLPSHLSRDHRYVHAVARVLQDWAYLEASVLVDHYMDDRTRAHVGHISPDTSVGGFLTLHYRRWTQTFSGDPWDDE
jgi:hypothetical protein